MKYPEKPNLQRPKASQLFPGAGRGRGIDCKWARGNFKERWKRSKTILVMVAPLHKFSKTLNGALTKRILWNVDLDKAFKESRLQTKKNTKQKALAYHQAGPSLSLEGRMWLRLWVPLVSARSLRSETLHVWENLILSFLWIFWFHWLGNAQLFLQPIIYTFQRLSLARASLLLPGISWARPQIDLHNSHFIV